MSEFLITEGHTPANHKAGELLAELDALGNPTGFSHSALWRENVDAKDWLRDNHPDLVIDPEDRRSYPDIAADLGRIAGA